MHFTLFEITIGNGFDLTIFGIARKYHRARALFRIGYWPKGWDIPHGYYRECGAHAIYHPRARFQFLSILFFRIDRKPAPISIIKSNRRGDQDKEACVGTVTGDSLM